MADRDFFANKAERENDSVIKDRQNTGRAFMLRLRFKGRRKPVAIAWAMFNDAEIQEIEHKNGNYERLTLLFAQRVVFIDGYFLERLLDDFETERTTIVQELDSSRVSELLEKYENASPSSVKPVVKGIEILPDLETRVTQVLNQGEIDDQP